VPDLHEIVEAAVETYIAALPAEEARSLWVKTRPPNEVPPRIDFNARIDAWIDNISDGDIRPRRTENHR
jgi:hypothetical protein